MLESLKRCWFLWGLIGAAILWAVAYGLDPSGLQGNIFFKKGETWFSDFNLIQKYLLEADYYRPADGDWYASNYTALPRLIFAAFPNSVGGGWCFILLSSFLYLASLWVFAGARGLPRWLTVFAGVGTNVFFFTVERCNSIMMAAAAVALFLAWFDSPSRGKRTVAAAMLAFAGVSKVSPALLGILYFRKMQWREIFLCAAFAVLLFFPPFFLPGYGGADGMCQWFVNSKANAEFYLPFGSFGLSPFLSFSSKVLTRFGRAVTPDDLLPVVHLSKAIGLFFVIGSFFEKRLSVRVLLTLAALLVSPGNQHAYCGLYLVPVMFWVSVDLDKWWLKAGTLAMFFAFIVPVAPVARMLELSMNALTMAFAAYFAVVALRDCVKSRKENADEHR